MKWWWLWLTVWISAPLISHAQIPIVALHDCSPHTTLHQTPVPQWVAQVSAPITDIPSDGDCEVLLLDKQVHVDQEITYHHIIKRILTRNGAHRHSMVELTFDPSFQRPVLHTLYVHRQGMRLDQVRTMQMHLLPASQIEEDPAHARRWSLIALLDDVREGDIIEYSYSAEGHNPCYLERTVDECPFQHTFPVGRIFYRLTGRYPCQVHVKSHQMQIDSVMHDIGQDHWECVWNKVHIPGFTDETNQPSWYQDAPWVQISEFTDWTEVANWGHKLFSPPLRLPSKVAQKVNEWRNQNLTTEAKAAAAVRFVQDEIALIPSDSNELHYPSDLNDVIARKKADSVDKAYLLKTCLHALGIPVKAAAVSACHRRAVAEWLAAPTAFDRVILRVQIEDRMLWVDPTASCQGGTLGRGGCGGYQRALLFEPGVTQLTALGMTEAESSIHSEVTYYLWPDTLDTSLLIETTYRGEAADSLRRALRSKGEIPLLAMFKEAYARAHGQVKTSSESTIEDRREADELIVKEHYHIPNLWQITDNGRKKTVHLEPLYIKAHLPDVDASHRRTPLALLYPIQIVETLQIVAPGYQWVKDARIKHLQDAAVEVQITRSTKGDTLTSQSDLRIVSDHVRPEDMEDYQELVSAVRNGISIEVSLPTIFDNAWDITTPLLAFLYMATAIGLLAFDPKDLH